MIEFDQVALIQTLLRIVITVMYLLSILLLLLYAYLTEVSHILPSTLYVLLLYSLYHYPIDLSYFWEVRAVIVQNTVEKYISNINVNF